jgi:hypothetical protein
VIGANVTQIPRRGELVGLGVLVAVSTAGALVSLFVVLVRSDPPALLRAAAYTSCGLAVVTWAGLAAAQRIRANYIARSLILARAITDAADEVSLNDEEEPSTVANSERRVRLADLHRAVQDASQRWDVLTSSGEVSVADTVRASVVRGREVLREGRPADAGGRRDGMTT